MCLTIARFILQIEAFLSRQEPEDGSAAEEEDEEVSQEEEPVKAKRRGGGMGSMLSPAMQTFLGCETMARPQVQYNLP